MATQQQKGKNSAEVTLVRFSDGRCRWCLWCSRAIEGDPVFLRDALADS
jgi:hypothetical protein